MQIIQGIACFITFLSPFSALYSHFFWVVEHLSLELANHKLGKSRKREKENDRETETKQHVVFVRDIERVSSLHIANCFASDQLASGNCRRTTLLHLLAKHLLWLRHNDRLIFVVSVWSVCLCRLLENG